MADLHSHQGGSDHIRTRCLDLLRQILGANMNFRAGQWEAIEMIAVKKKRALIVQRTGWGKSIIYFLATKFLREQGAGPTLLISPLLSLIRNQIGMAERFGLTAFSINSTNQDEWPIVQASLKADQCDLLLISPERLNNRKFLEEIMVSFSGRIGMFVVDEAHCISDWGHDFRPDYRRILRIIQQLPAGVPVLGTTATANNRVIDDIKTQLGDDLLVLRGPLTRESLRLQNIKLSSQSERLAWLAEHLPKFKGSGIVYCLTKADTERVTGWLNQNGIPAEAYHAGNDNEMDRPELERAFIENRVKVLVATVALGMGFDKPDIEFVVHFQRPGSVIAYYQQVGRAGRALDKSYGILLNGDEDDEIQDYFIDTAFPPVEVFKKILEILESSDSLSLYEILAKANISNSVAAKALKILEVDGAVGQEFKGKMKYFRTANPWKIDSERIEKVLGQRRQELAEMQGYVEDKGCLMAFLLKALDDPNPQECGRCANCRGKGFDKQVNRDLVIEAEKFLKGAEIVIFPRKKLPDGLLPGIPLKIPPEMQIESGRSLCYYGDAGWGKLVREGKYKHGKFDDDLINAAFELINRRWKPAPYPTWVTCIPSQRHPTLVPALAAGIAQRLGIPYMPVLFRVGNAPEQKMMKNGYMQAQNVIGSLQITNEIPTGSVLLVDDIIDSRWTITLAGYLLKQEGVTHVFPFTLAMAQGKD